MKERLSAEEIKKAVSVEDVLSHFRVDVKRKEKPYYIHCPFHAEKTPSFYVDVKDQVAYCFGCRRGGDAIALAMLFLNCSFKEAVEYLAREFLIASDQIGAKRKTDSKKELKNRFDLHVNRKLINRLKFSVRLDERARIPLTKRREYLFDELERILKEKGEEHPLCFLAAALDVFFNGLAILAEFNVEGYACFVEMLKKERFL